MYLGIDLGTSGLRALLIDDSQRVIAAADAGYDVQNPAPGYSEQRPADWVRALTHCMAELRKQHPKALAALKAVAVSGQMHGAVCLDAAGDVLRPAILWNDTRCAKEAAELDTISGVRGLSGNIVFPGFTAPKLLWMQHHEPEIYQRIETVLLPKDYLNYYLTGVFSAEMSDAAGTSWLDTGARAWSDMLLEAGQMRRDQMPDLHEGTDVIAELRSDLATDWGVQGRVVVAAGAGDNAAAACGTGCLNEGQGFLSLGTSGVLLAARDAYRPAASKAVHSFCHAVPDRWYQMGVILAATDSLNWLSNLTNQRPENLAAALPDQISAPERPMFLPYISGERTPHNDANIRAGFSGLDVSDGPVALTKAVMTGVAFAFRDCFEALIDTGAELDHVLAIGGGAQSGWWLEVLATVLDLPLAQPANQEFGAALGAARLAICAATDAKPDDIMTPPKTAGMIMPRRDLIDAYSAKYADWRKLYPALKEFS